MRNIVIVGLLLFAPQAAQAQLSGVPTPIAGDILIVQGVTVHLYGITAPKPDQLCRAKNKPYSCGLISRTALMDLVFGGTVRCRLRTETKAGVREADCESGGFDTAANMVHTGWAVADPLLGRKHAKNQMRARKAGRGLWRGEFSLPGRDN